MAAESNVAVVKMAGEADATPPGGTSPQGALFHVGSVEDQSVDGIRAMATPVATSVKTDDVTITVCDDVTGSSVGGANGSGSAPSLEETRDQSQRGMETDAVSTATRSANQSEPAETDSVAPLVGAAITGDQGGGGTQGASPGAGQKEPPGSRGPGLGVTLPLGDNDRSGSRERLEAGTPPNTPGACVCACVCVRVCCLPVCAEAGGVHATQFSRCACMRGCACVRVWVRVYVGER